MVARPPTAGPDVADLVVSRPRPEKARRRVRRSPRTVYREYRARKEAARPGAQFPTHRARRAHLFTLSLVLAFASMLAVLVYQASKIDQRDVAITSLESQVYALSNAAPPAGFAEGCVSEWLNAGSSAAENAPLTGACRPIGDGSDLNGQERNMLQATSVEAQPAPASFVDPDDRNVASILVAAHVLEWHPTDNNPAATSGGWDDRGFLYYRVTVYTDPDSGVPMLMSWPSLRRPPSITGEAPEYQAVPSSADPRDVRTATLSDFFSRFLIAPPASDPRSGDVTLYLAPGSSIEPAHYTTIKATDIIRTAYTENADGSTTALVVLKVTMIGGHATVQTYPVQLVQSGSKWLVASLLVAPPIKTN